MPKMTKLEKAEQEALKSLEIALLKHPSFTYKPRFEMDSGQGRPKTHAMKIAQRILNAVQERDYVAADPQYDDHLFSVTFGNITAGIESLLKNLPTPSEKLAALNAYETLAGLTNEKDDPIVAGFTLERFGELIEERRNIYQGQETAVQLAVPEGGEP